MFLLSLISFSVYLADDLMEKECVYGRVSFAYDNLLTIVLCFDISLSFLSSLRHLYSLSPVPRYTPL